MSNRCQANDRGCIRRYSAWSYGFSASVLLSIAVLCSPLSAATYFVRTSGQDSQSGLMPSRALNSLARAAELAQGGDTVVVGGGTYVEPLQVVQRRPAKAAVVFLADSDGSLTGDPGPVSIAPGKGAAVYLENSRAHLRGFQIRGTVWCKQTERAELSSCEIVTASRSGIRCDGPGSAQVMDCRISDGRATGLRITRGFQMEVIRTTISDNRGRGVLIADEQSTLNLRQSKLIGNEAVAVDARGSSSLINCLIARNGAGIRADSDDVSIWHTTIIRNQTFGIEQQRGRTAVSNSIIAFNGTFGVGGKAGQLLLGTNVVFGNSSVNFRQVGVLPIAATVAVASIRPVNGSRCPNAGSTWLPCRVAERR